LRRAQLGEALLSTCSDIGVVHGPSEQVDDVVIASELGEVLVCQVDRPRDCTRGTQTPKLVELSLPAGHAATIHPRADAALHSA